MTDLIHGENRRKAVEKVNETLFGNNDINALYSIEIEILASEIPTSKIGCDVISALTENNLVKSASEARRLIQSNAISINGQKIKENQQINKISLIKKGKNSFVLIK